MSGVRVNSREELERYFRENPLQLRAARPSRGPRPGSAGFIGPVAPSFLARLGALVPAPDGSVAFTIRKEPWERAHIEKLLKLTGEL